jgi:hypothetical protein
MAQSLPYIVEGFMIDFKTKYYVSSTGQLTLQPDSYLTIQENTKSWVLEHNSAITAMRHKDIAFCADLQSFEDQHQQHPVRWILQPAHYIRDILAKEFLLLTRIDQLRLVKHVQAGGIMSPGHVQSASQDDECIAKFAHDLRTNGTFMPTAVFWLISQLCVVGSAMSGKNMARKAGLKWSRFSVCLFEIDNESLGPGNSAVTVKSNNVVDWTALVHYNDNADTNLVTLACLLLNHHYYAADVFPRQIAGATSCANDSIMKIGLPSHPTEYFLFVQGGTDEIW